MVPDFSEKTRETVAKRASFSCSNPDCGVSTVGPNIEADKATVIGEAAHIQGARPGSARYDAAMSDTTRGAITNAIWLCRNCHKKIDRDPERYSVALLYSWREEHEEAAASNLGNRSDRILARLESEEASEFLAYPPLVRRIVVDRPPGWEWRLTAEILRYLNRPLFRRMRDLRDGAYTQPLERIGDDELLDWARHKLAEMTTLVPPFVTILARMSESWGEPGEPGSAAEIHHACRLLHDNLQQIVDYEERVHFVQVSEEFESLLSFLKGHLSEQADKLATIPDKLDGVVAVADELVDGEGSEPRVITEEIVFELPPGWEKGFSREFRKAERMLGSSGEVGSSDSGTGCAVVGLLLLVILIVWILI